jgi:hypothetical protein
MDSDSNGNNSRDTLSESTPWVPFLREGRWRRAVAELSMALMDNDITYDEDSRSILEGLLEFAQRKEEV